MRIALRNQGISDGAEVRYVRAGGSCDGTPVAPRLVAGAQFTVCVIRHVRIPGVPSVLAGKGITTVGRYVVHVDDFRVVS